MSSEIRANTLKNRVGLSTINITNTGIVVSGVSTFSGVSNFNSNVSVSGNLNVAQNIVHTGDTDTKIEFLTDTLCFDTAGSERLRIASNGKVGVGVNPINYPGIFVVSGDALICDRDIHSRVANSVANSDRGFKQDIDGTEKLHLYADNSSDVILENNGGNERLRITSDGKVGINSTAPNSRLDVIESSASRTWTPGTSVMSMFERNSNTRIAIVSGASSYGEIDFGDSSDDNAGYIRYDHSDDSMSFRTATTERLRITSAGYREIRNYHYGPWAFVNNTTKTTITVGDPGDNKFTTIKLILTLIDGAYRQGMWQGEYTIFASNSVGGPGVNYYLKEHWQQVGSANWSGGTVGVSITSSGALQIIADNGHNDAAGNAYIHILDVIGDINGTTVASISP